MYERAVRCQRSASSAWQSEDRDRLLADRVAAKVSRVKDVRAWACGRRVTDLKSELRCIVEHEVHGEILVVLPGWFLRIGSYPAWSLAEVLSSVCRLAISGPS